MAESPCPAISSLELQSARKLLKLNFVSNQQCHDTRQLQTTITHTQHCSPPRIKQSKYLMKDIFIIYLMKDKNLSSIFDLKYI